jgi:hypothetical protein
MPCPALAHLELALQHHAPVVQYYRIAQYGVATLHSMEQGLVESSNVPGRAR